jgi:ABC-2 type transport system ATP-binding protein
MSIVRISSLIKRFGNFTALDGIDLEVKRGEIYGFIGPNGAGKTTTIRVLLGILKATGARLKSLEWMHGRMQ